MSETFTVNIHFFNRSQNFISFSQDIKQKLPLQYEDPKFLQIAELNVILWAPCSFFYYFTN